MICEFAAVCVPGQSTGESDSASRRRCRIQSTRPTEGDATRARVVATRTDARGRHDARRGDDDDDDDDGDDGDDGDGEELAPRVGRARATE